MRLSVRSLRRVVKGDLPIEFVRQELSSYAAWSCCADTCTSSP
jgi:hypothetical protein